jgi:saccharopine dehydrogenase (NAD+, L-lysine-forming)
MNKTVAIRREDKNVWERRVPLVPAHVAQLQQEHGLQFCVQASEIRAFPDVAYRDVGAEIRQDVSDCPVMFAVKEIPIDYFRPNGTYVFFAHVIKGQEYNMPMLRHLLDRNCTLIDYEKITDDRNRRLIFFGRHAGMAGMIDSLWALGQRLEWEGIPTPFSQVKPAHTYGDSDSAKEAIRTVGEQIAAAGLPEALTPFVCGFAGYGNVGRGAMEIYDQLPIVEITPEELLSLGSTGIDPRTLIKVVFQEVHTVRPSDPARPFDLQDFFAHPERYESQFEPYVPHLSMLINAIYWKPTSPRLVTKAYLRDLYSGERAPRLRVIGDISCDIEGGIEATIRATEPDDPVYVYEPLTGHGLPGVAGRGPVIMAVDNLPCELPVESSTDFSTALLPYVPPIVTADYTVPFETCALPPEIKRAVIVYQGELTPDYRYLEQFL